VTVQVTRASCPKRYSPSKCLHFKSGHISPKKLQRHSWYEIYIFRKLPYVNHSYYLVPETMLTLHVEGRDWITLRSFSSMQVSGNKPAV
jgi:hypothetical protein